MGPRREHQIGGGDSVGTIRSHHSCVRIYQRLLSHTPYFRPIGVEYQTDAGHFRDVTVSSIVRSITLKEDDPVTTLDQCAKQSAQDCRVAIAPRRTNS